ncbi:unnamed protein product [Spirodela intermedia]|uniref:Uncharacterized protein n=1 Tax=Spirodela intermedia TaxID=51605 RepID=A0A7I8IV88_SPIIN|nr:unnamed protein product [Spirodela intermedia]CAA6661483.1 unnamed protein product [Spirodela intermedia]
MENACLRASMRRKTRRTAAARSKKTAQRPGAASLCAVKEERRQTAAPLGTVGRKFRELQALVPGGEGLHADQLFLRTAGYILHLKLQVHLLRALSDFQVP